MAEITYDIAGFNNFLSQAEYRMYILNFLKEFEDQFQLAEQVEIVFEDVLNPDPKNLPHQKPIVSDDGKEIKVNYKTFRYSENKQGLSKPDKQSFFSGFRYYFENTVIKEDNERFDALHTNKRRNKC